MFTQNLALQRKLLTSLAGGLALPANAMSEATMNILLTDFMASGYFDEIFAYSVVSKGCGNADGIAGHAYFYLFVPVEVVSFFILWLKSRPCEKFLSDLCTCALQK